MYKHKKEAIIASIILSILGITIILYFTVNAFRIIVQDAYHSIFKVVISDRVLKREGEVFSNLIYCQPGTTHQTLDLFLPDRTAAERVPLVVFLHGGGWRTGDKANREVSFYGESLLHSGIAVASINYRLAPQYTYPTQDKDVACALSYLHEHASHYQLNDKWALFGDSAGAQLAADAMADSTINQSLVAFIGFYGPYDLSLQTNRQPKKDIDAIIYTNKSRDVASASPIHKTGKKDAYYLLYHGSKDRIVPPVQSRLFYDALRTSGISAKLTIVQNASHSFGSLSRPSSQEIRKDITANLVDLLKN
ncbi:MAG: alpha/beta hydrolase [Candidatus Saccharimonadales bacterium]